MSRTTEEKALTVKMSGEDIARHGETLRLAAIGKLEVYEDVFGEKQSQEAQIEEARREVARHIELILKTLNEG